jgi:hypothetical protein
MRVVQKLLILTIVVVCSCAAPDTPRKAADVDDVFSHWGIAPPRGLAELCSGRRAASAEIPAFHWYVFASTMAHDELVVYLRDRLGKPSYELRGPETSWRHRIEGQPSGLILAVFGSEPPYLTDECDFTLPAHTRSTVMVTVPERAAPPN